MKKNELPLHHVSLGEKVIIKKLDTNESIKRRLLDMGMIEGTEVECALVSPFGDPKAYFIRGALIAIRNSDASSILVERVKGEA